MNNALLPTSYSTTHRRECASNCTPSLGSDILIQGLKTEVGSRLCLLLSLLSCHYPPYLLISGCTGHLQFHNYTKLPLLTHLLHMLIPPYGHSLSTSFPISSFRQQNSTHSLHLRCRFTSLVKPSLLQSNSRAQSTCLLLLCGTMFTSFIALISIYNCTLVISIRVGWTQQDTNLLHVDHPIKLGEADIYFNHLVPDGRRLRHACQMFRQSSSTFSLPSPRTHAFPSLPVSYPCPFASCCDTTSGPSSMCDLLCPDLLNNFGFSVLSHTVSASKRSYPHLHISKPYQIQLSV